MHYFDTDCFLAVKLIGKLEDGTVFLKKGHEDGEEPVEFMTDEGTSPVGLYSSLISVSLEFSL